MSMDRIRLCSGCGDRHESGDLTGEGFCGECQAEVDGERAQEIEDIDGAWQYLCDHCDEV